MIENRGGAGGTIATRQVAKAEPDGYTLLIATSSLAINPSLYPNVGYDPRKDFAPIGLIASSSNVVLVNPSVPVRSIAELIALAKQQDGKLDFASTGTGSSVHLAAELFAGMAGVKLNHVPYKGSGPALNDLLGGHVALMFSTMASAVGLVRDGSKVRALGGDGREAVGAVPGSADRRRGRPARLRGGAALWDRRAGRHAAPGRRKAQRRAQCGARRRRREASGSRSKAPRRCPSSPEEYAADIAREETKWSEIIRKAG